MQEQNIKGLKGRSQYQADYYQKTKAKRKECYIPQTQYVRIVEVKKVLNNLKKQIGLINYGLVMDEMNKLEVKKM